MADGYSNFVNNGFGKKLAKQIGLPQPPVLRRYEVGQDLLDGPAAVGTVGSGVVGSTAAAILRGSGADVVDATAEATYSDKLGAFVIDVTAAMSCHRAPRSSASRTDTAMKSSSSLLSATECRRGSSGQDGTGKEEDCATIRARVATAWPMRSASREKSAS